MTMRALLLTLATLLATSLASAQTMYKCTGADGRVAFQQAPCDSARGGKAEAVRVPQANVVEGNPAGEAAVRSEAARSQAVRLALARGQLITGMTESEVVQLLGQPEVVNTDNIEGRVNRQLVYRYPDGSTRYVYTRNGYTYASQERPSTGVVRQPERRTCFTDGEIHSANVEAGRITYTEGQKARNRAEVERMKQNRC
jgi:hypothetical protein